ncbi:hypothetical protein Sros01_59270 [Streptomyces roseochromogenus]|nr:hypothetical protein Sros01_59270 [Streptomyces roseochromogenus]
MTPQLLQTTGPQVQGPASPPPHECWDPQAVRQQVDTVLDTFVCGKLDGGSPSWASPPPRTRTPPASRLPSAGPVWAPRWCSPRPSVRRSSPLCTAAALLPAVSATMTGNRCIEAALAAAPEPGEPCRTASGA